MHKSQSIALIKELTLVGDSQVTLCLPLYNIWLEYNIIHIIHRNYAPHAWKLNLVCMCLVTVDREIFADRTNRENLSTQQVFYINYF